MNLLAPGGLIIARLQQALDATAEPGSKPVKVYGTPDLPSIQDEQHLAPAVFVTFQGADPDQVKSDGMWVAWRTTWIVTPVVRNRRDPRQGIDSAEQGGELMTRCAEILQGAKLARGWTALRAAQPPGSFFDVGFAYYPLAFSTTTELKGDTPE